MNEIVESGRLIRGDPNFQAAPSQAIEALHRVSVQIRGSEFVGDSGVAALLARCVQVESGPEDFKSATVMLATLDHGTEHREKIVARHT